MTQPVSPPASPLPPASPAPPSPLTLGQVATSAVQILRRRPGYFLGLAFVPALVAATLVPFVTSVVTSVLVGAVVRALLSRDTSGIGQAFVSALALVLVVLAVLVVVQLKSLGMTVFLAHETAHGRSPGLLSLVTGTRWVVLRALPLVALYAIGPGLLQAVFAVAVFGSVVESVRGGDLGDAAQGVMGTLRAISWVGSFVGVVAFYLSVRWIYLPQGLAVEGRGPFSSLANSWRLTRGAFLRTLGWSLLPQLAIGVALAALGALSMGVSKLPTDATGEPRAPFAGAGPAMTFLYTVLLSVVGTVVIPVTVSYLTVMYVDQRRRLGLEPEAAQAEQDDLPRSTASQRASDQIPLSSAIDHPSAS